MKEHLSLGVSLNAYLLFIFIVIFLALTFSCKTEEGKHLIPVDFKKVASGLTAPVKITNANDKSDRLFVVEQRGTIRVITNGKLSPGFFLDIRENVVSGGEKGLLGLAFHPDFSQNGLFYINYTTPIPLRTVISEFKVNDSHEKTKKSERVILEVKQPYGNHNGGEITFGVKGDPYLYISLGDGGSGGDPHRHGQNLKTLLGAILRIDVNKRENSLEYAIPDSNPKWSSVVNAKREIWAYGLRNPWRFSFDPVTGDLYAGDVGQDSREEIDIIQKGANYGWNQVEGDICFMPDCHLSSFSLPIISHERSVMTVITGGVVYRGKLYPELKGVYIYGDFSSGLVRGLRYEQGKVVMQGDFNGSIPCLSTFGYNEEYEVYAADWCSGTIYQVLPPASMQGDNHGY